MPLTLNFGSKSTDLSSTADLVKFLESNGPAELKFLSDVTQFASETLQNIGNQQVSLKFSTSKQLKWNLGTNGNVTFGFSPSASAAVSIQTTGTLFTYKLSDGSPEVAVPVPAKTGYVSITFNVSLSVSAGASFSHAGFGVSGNASAGSTFAVSFRKAFPLTAYVVTAITQAFESFTLPFQPDGVSRIADGDFMDYEYLGSIKAGFGLSYGVSGSLLGGRSVGEINQSFNLSPFGKAVVNANPSFDLSAKFAFAYDHEDKFHVILERRSNAATLLYFRSDSNSISTTESLGIKLSAGAHFNLTSDLPDLAGKIAASALSGVSGTTGVKAATSLVNALTNSASGELQKFVNDVNSKVNGLLSKGDGQTIQLQFQQEHLTANTALFSFEFDLRQPDALTKGYPLAVSGDFAGAIQVAGVALDPGSFIEHTWIQASSASFQFFDLFKFSDVTQYFQDSKLIYAGNNQFRIMFQTGVKDTITVNSAQNSCEVYFTATAPANSKATTTGDLVVTLNFTMIDHTSKAAQETKRALRFIGGAALQAAEDAIPANLKGALTVNCQFPQAAFSMFNCDEYNGAQPSRLPHPFDAANYSAFIAAVQGIVPKDSVDQDFLRFFMSYDSWVEFNRVKFDQEGSQKPPDRHQIGNPAVSVWPSRLIRIDPLERSGLQCYLYSAQSFMNLCESLKHLGSGLDSGTFDDDFDLLIKSLDRIIKQNIAVFFIKPTLAALFRIGIGAASDVQLTTSGDNIGIVFTAQATAAAARAMTAGR